MHKPESVEKNETHKILRDFVIQTHHIIPARRPDQVIIKRIKRTRRIADFTVPPDHTVKIKENEKKRNILRSCQRTKQAMEHESDGDTNNHWCTWNDPQRLSKRAEGVESRRTSGDHVNYSIV